jgi:hypothetical protein
MISRHLASWCYVSTKGYHACPKGKPKHIILSLQSHVKKIITIAIVNGLPMDHHFWKNIATFDGIREIRMAPPQVEAGDVLQWGYMRKMFLHEGWHLHFNDLDKGRV